VANQISSENVLNTHQRPPVTSFVAENPDRLSLNGLNKINRISGNRSNSVLLPKNNEENTAT